MTISKYIEVKSANTNGVFKIIANKGVCWQVEDPEDGSLFLVQKKQVVRGPWEEDGEDDLEAESKALAANHAPTFAEALAQVKAAAEPKPKAESKPKAERDPNLVTLKELCFELNVIPRIARRRLRKAQGQVGTGSRWEWKKNSPELDAVKKVLTATTAAPTTEEK